MTMAHGLSRLDLDGMDELPSLNPISRSPVQFVSQEVPKNNEFLSGSATTNQGSHDSMGLSNTVCSGHNAPAVTFKIRKLMNFEHERNTKAVAALGFSDKTIKLVLSHFHFWFWGPKKVSMSDLDRSNFVKPTTKTQTESHEDEPFALVHLEMEIVCT